MTTTQSQVSGKHTGAPKGARLLTPVGIAGMLRRMRRGFQEEEEGSALVEMSFVMTVLMLVVMGISSYGVALNQYLVLTNAVNNGSRAFAMSAPAVDGGVSVMDSGDPCKYAASTIQTSASNLTASNLSYTIIYTVNSTGTSTTYTGTGTSAPTCAGIKMSAYDVVQIKAVYPTSAALYGRSTSLNLTAQSTELVQ